jgi:8-oxo-dGTP diphosphatase
MKKYVLGFAFDWKRENIVLIEKQKPDWQKGKLNGVGGKLETTDSSIHDAMVREFFEETGVLTQKQDWTHYATMSFDNDIMTGSAEIYVFRMRNNEALQCSTYEEEEVKIIPIDKVYNEPLMHNLHILIPLALQKEFGFTHLQQAMKPQEPVRPYHL